MKLWISWTEISKNAFKNGIIQSSICFCSFFFLHSTFTFTDLFLLSSSPDPRGTIPSLFYSHAIHSNVYRSLVWPSVYVSGRTTGSDAKALQDSHGYRKMGCRIDVVMSHLVFAEICVSLSKEEIKMNETEHTDVKCNNKWVSSFPLPPPRCGHVTGSSRHSACVITRDLLLSAVNVLWCEMVKSELQWGSENVGTEEKDVYVTSAPTRAGLQPSPHRLRPLTLKTWESRV